MKRVLSLCLALCMIVTTFSLQVIAAGDELGPYGGSNGQVDDNLSDIVPSFNKQYAVAFTDFEGLSDSYADGFGIIDSGIEKRDSVFKIPAMTGWATPGTVNTQYSWNGSTLTLFSEPLTVGEKYIISYDYYTVPSTISPAKAYSFSPKHDFFWIGDDHRNEPPAYNDGLWRTVKMCFVADVNKTDMKANTMGTGVSSYIDNYLVMEAAEVTLTDASGVVKITSINDTLVETAHAGDPHDIKYMVAKGDKLELKVDAPSIVAVTVTVGDNEIEPNEDGIYVINKVTSDISVETSVNKSSLNKMLKNTAIIDDDDNIYIPYGRTVYTLADDFYQINGYSTTKTLSCLDSFELDLDINKTLSVDDKIYSKFGYIESNKFNVKYSGDANEDGKISVTDISSIVGRLVNNNGADNFSGLYDFDANKNINVTDIVGMRKIILGNSSDSRDIEADIIVKSGVELDFIEFDNGVYNAGNQAALANVIRKVMRGEEVILAAFGGSITAEGNEDAMPEDNSGIKTTLAADSYADVMLHWFEKTFSKYGAKFTLINAGIGATDTPYAIHRMYEDVVNAIPGKKPDMVVYEWACNDNTAEYKQGTFENGVRKFLEEDIAVLIFAFDQVFHDGTQKMQEPIADFYDLPLLSYNDALGALPKWQYLSKSDDRVHPNRVGHALAGTIITRYLGKILSNIDSISTVVPEIPEDTYNAEGAIYNDTFIARLSDIEAGKVDGVRIKSRGSFIKDTSTRIFDNDANKDYKNIVSCKKEYYGYDAVQNESGVYEPLVIEVDDAKTAFILFNRFDNPLGCKFDVYVDEVQLTCPYGSFTCSKDGTSDNMQIESGFHWATSRLFYNPTPKKVTIKITPNLGAYSDNQGTGRRHVKLFALLLSK